MEEQSFFADWEILPTVDFITTGKHQHVALQFPDELLAVAPRVAATVSKHCHPDTKIAVLADSAFHPEAIDEVAAQHMAATCVVHYGHASLGACSLPVFNVFPKLNVDPSDCARALSMALQAAPPGSNTIAFFDQGLLHAAAIIIGHLKQLHNTQMSNLVVAQSSTINGLQAADVIDQQGDTSSDESQAVVRQVAGYRWTQPTNLGSCCWIGPTDSGNLQVLQLALPHVRWHHVCVDKAGHIHDPGSRSELSSHTALLKRRYFLVEKARSSAILGILVGTLASAELVQAMTHLRNLIHAAGKKSYTMLVGKPNPAKLANFPEVEIWVQLSDPLAAIIDSRSYLSPVITPHEAVLALTGTMLTPSGPMHLGLSPLMANAEVQQAQLAAARATYDTEISQDDRGSLDQVVKHAEGLALGSHGGGQLAQPRHGAEYLQLRTWKGVEAPVTGGEVKKPSPAVEGLKGRAAVYEGESYS